MTQEDKKTVLDALEELKGDCVGIIAATIEDCQKVVRELPEGFLPRYHTGRECLMPAGDIIAALERMAMSAGPKNDFILGCAAGKIYTQAERIKTLERALTNAKAALEVDV